QTRVAREYPATAIGSHVATGMAERKRRRSGTSPAPLDTRWVRCEWNLPRYCRSMRGATPQGDTRKSRPILTWTSRRPANAGRRKTVKNPGKSACVGYTVRHMTGSDMLPGTVDVVLRIVEKNVGAEGFQERALVP